MGMKTVIFRLQRVAGLLVCGLLLGGCVAPPAKYVPQTIGSSDTGDVIDGLEVVIKAASDRVILGKPVHFDITITNSGHNSIWIPKDPHLIFVWVYPNGRRDNVVQELPPRRHYNNKSAILLGPGKTFSKNFTIRTHYFPKSGITEFRAIMQSPENTNPRLAPFWQGRALSNAYGVLVQKPSFRS